MCLIFGILSVVCCFFFIAVWHVRNKSKNFKAKSLPFLLAHSLRFYTSDSCLPLVFTTPKFTPSMIILSYVIIMWNIFSRTFIFYFDVYVIVYNYKFYNLRYTHTIIKKNTNNMIYLLYLIGFQ